MAQCKMNNVKCKIKEETPLGVSKIYISFSNSERITSIIMHYALCIIH